MELNKRIRFPLASIETYPLFVFFFQTSVASVAPKSNPTIAQKPDKDKSKVDTSETVSLKQYEDLLQRLQKLEAIVEKQNEAIEDLRNKLQVECDLRMLLQEKMENYEV